MSVQHAKDFMKKVIMDESFAKNLDKVTKEEDFFILAKEAGFDFTLEEWQRVRDGVEAQAKAYAEENNIQVPDELTDEQLEAVAGGGAWRQGLATGFGWLGGYLGAAAGGIALGATTSGLGAIVGVGGGALAGAVGGAAFGDLIGQWIEEGA